MVRELAVDKKQGIEQLSACEMPMRQIARTLDIDRKSVDRHLASLSSKGATCKEAPTGSDDSKGAKAPTAKPADETANASDSKGTKT